MLDSFSLKKQEKIRKEAAKNGVKVEIYLHSKYAEKAAKKGYASVADFLKAKHDLREDKKKAKAKSKKEGPNPKTDTSSSSSSSSDSEWLIVIKIRSLYF